MGGGGSGWKRLTLTPNSALRTVAAAGRLVVVHVDALQLQVGVAVVGAGGVDAVLIGDDLPELRADLVAALSSLNSNLSRGEERKWETITLVDARAQSAAGMRGRWVPRGNFAGEG